jgi:hypothetical protein
MQNINCMFLCQKNAVANINSVNGPSAVFPYANRNQLLFSVLIKTLKNLYEMQTKELAQSVCVI